MYGIFSYRTGFGVNVYKLIFQHHGSYMGYVSHNSFKHHKDTIDRYYNYFMVDTTGFVSFWFLSPDFFSHLQSKVPGSSGLGGVQSSLLNVYRITADISIE